MKLNLIDFNVIFTAFWYSCGFLGGNHRFHKNMIYHKNVHDPDSLAQIFNRLACNQNEVGKPSGPLKRYQKKFRNTKS